MPNWWCPGRPALNFAGGALLRTARTLKVQTNASGSEVTELIADIAGEQEILRDAANGAKQLSMSANGAHPNGLGERAWRTGLANGSDQVGRDYMFHNSQRCWR